MKKIQITLLSCLALMMSCQENPDEVPAPEEVVLEKDENLDEPAHKFAKLLSVSMKDNSVRNFIKEEAVAQFDGDYDILFASAKNKTVAGITNARGASMTFRDVLYAQAGAARVDNLELDELMTQLELTYPTIQISVPPLTSISAEAWETNSLNPLVAVLDSDFSEQTTETITAYNSDGNSFELSVNEEPDQLTVVISPNERVLAFSNDELNSNYVKGAPVSKSQIHTIYLVEDVTEDYGGTWNGLVNGAMRTDACIYPQYYCPGESTHEVLHRIKIKNLSDYESWAQGSPELRMQMNRIVSLSGGTYAISGIGTKSYKPSKRKYINNKWWPVDGCKGGTLKNFTTNEWNMLWYEDDGSGGGTVFTTVTLRAPDRLLYSQYNYRSGVDDYFGNRKIDVSSQSCDDEHYLVVGDIRWYNRWDL